VTNRRQYLVSWQQWQPDAGSLVFFRRPWAAAGAGGFRETAKAHAALVGTADRTGTQAMSIKNLNPLGPTFYRALTPIINDPGRWYNHFSCQCLPLLCLSNAKETHWQLLVVIGRSFRWAAFFFGHVSQDTSRPPQLVRLTWIMCRAGGGRLQKKPARNPFETFRTGQSIDRPMQTLTQKPRSENGRINLLDNQRCQTTCPSNPLIIGAADFL